MFHDDSNPRTLTHPQVWIMVLVVKKLCWLAILEWNPNFNSKDERKGEREHENLMQIGCNLSF